MQIANKYGNIFEMASLLSAIRLNESNFEKKLLSEHAQTRQICEIRLKINLHIKLM